MTALVDRELDPRVGPSLPGFDHPFVADTRPGGVRSARVTPTIGLPSNQPSDSRPTGRLIVVSDRSHSPGPPVLRVGCAMWAHPPWVGRFLTSSGKGRELAEYAGWCNAVEGNTTFYGIPVPRTIDRWVEQAPDHFRFAFKIPRTVTHEQRLRTGAHRDVARFLRTIEPLGDRIGPVQLQLPRSFGPESLSTLIDFVVGLPTSHRWVTELRHPAFFDGGEAHRRVDEALGSAGVGRVVLDTRSLYASSPRSEAAVEERRTKPKLPVVTEVMGDEPIVRVIGSDDPDETLAGAGAWTDQIVDWLAEGRRPFVFVHQPENLESPSVARRFHATIGKCVPDLEALPEPAPVAEHGEMHGQTPLF